MISEEDFSGHWSLDPTREHLEGKKEIGRKPRAYKSIHSSEYVTIKRNGKAQFREMAQAPDAEKIGSKEA